MSIFAFFGINNDVAIRDATVIDMTNEMVPIMPEDDDWEYLESPGCFYREWNLIQSEEDDDEAIGTHYLRTRMTNVISQTLRHNPFFLHAHLTRVLKSYRIELAFVRVRDAQMKALHKLMKPAASSPVIKSACDVLDTLPVNYQARVLSRTEVSAVFRRYQPDMHRIKQQERDQGDLLLEIDHTDPAYHPQDRWCNLPSWNTSVTGCRHLWTQIMALNDDIHTITSPWWRIDAPLRLLPCTDHDCSDSEDEEAPIRALESADQRARRRAKDILKWTLQEFDHEWTHNFCSSEQFFYSIIFAPEDDPTDWATLGKPDYTEATQDDSPCEYDYRESRVE